MATEKEIQLNLADNLGLQAVLGKMTATTAKPKLSAKWFTIKISPDLATEELLNIGVGIIHRKKLFTKLIPNSTPFETLYGTNGKENFSFLLSLLRSGLDNVTSLNSISPHISFSKQKFISGNSIDEMLDRLFKSMVSLSLIQQKDKDSVSTNQLSTENVRKKVFSALKNADKDLTSRVWHNEDNPIIIPPDLGEEIILNHLQIWSPPTLLQKTTRFGSVISTDYKKTMAREFYLLQAAQDIQRAAASLNREQHAAGAGLFIYRPQLLQGESQADLDNAIDRTHWLIKKNIGLSFNMEVEDNIDSLASKTRAFLAAA